MGRLCQLSWHLHNKDDKIKEAWDGVYFDLIPNTIDFVLKQKNSVDTKAEVEHQKEKAEGSLKSIAIGPNSLYGV